MTLIEMEDLFKKRARNGYLMRNYLIIVEGAHDIAVLEKLLKLNGINRRIASAEELPEVWKRTIPSVFPFAEERLDRITPIPSFL